MAAEAARAYMSIGEVLALLRQDFPDVTVSRHHAEFAREGGGFSVRDVGSLNGTYVNRQRIDQAGLSGGDEVQIGKFRLVFLTNPQHHH